MDATSSPSIVNNTISFNYGGNGIANSGANNPTVMNNIITSKGVYGIHADGTSTPTNSHNDVWANTWGQYWGTSGGTGSIAQDPRFVSIFDAHLLCSSAAINAANPNAATAPSIDYDNNPRPVGGRINMGAYEKQSGQKSPLYLPLIPH